MALLVRLAVAVAEANEPRAMRRRIVTELDAVPAMVDSLAREADARWPPSQSGSRRRASCSSPALGPNFAAAAFGAAKVRELSPIHAIAMPLEEYHHYRAQKAGDPLFLVATDRGEPRARARHRAGEREGRRADGRDPVGRDRRDRDRVEATITVPPVRPALAPLVASIPLHLFAYHFAKARFARGLGYPGAFPRRDAMVEVFTGGGIIIDNVVAADGAVHLETMGGNAVYSAAGARLWPMRSASSASSRATIPPVARRLAAAGIDIAGDRDPRRKRSTRSEWFFYRADGSRVDHLHAAAGRAPGVRPRAAAHLASATPAVSRTICAPARHGRGFAEFRRDHPVEMRHVRAFSAGRAALIWRRTRPKAQRRNGAGAGGTGSVARSRVPASQHCAGDLDMHPRPCRRFPAEREGARRAHPGRSPGRRLHLAERGGSAGRGGKHGGAGSSGARGGSGRSLAHPDAAGAALDPTGAGDAFCGGFLAGLIRTGDPFAAACFGTVSASFAVEAFGPFHLLDATRDEARARFGI